MFNNESENSDTENILIVNQSPQHIYNDNEDIYFNENIKSSATNNNTCNGIRILSADSGVLRSYGEKNDDIEIKDVSEVIPKTTLEYDDSSIHLTMPI